MLAAGAARRFGGDKLLAEFRGRPLAAHAADTLAGMGFDHLIAACPADSAARVGLFTSRGFEIVWVEHPEDGMGRSLAIGAARALELGAEALLVCLADMPNVDRGHLERVLAAYDGATSVATEVDGIRMPPALFPKALFPALVALTGDSGAKPLLRGARLVAADAATAVDIDTADDLRR